MTNTIAPIGIFESSSMLEFAAQVEAGALSKTERSLFYHGLEAAGVRDHKFLRALARGDTRRLAQLSRGLKRANYLLRARSRLGHVSLFASRDNFMEQISRVLANVIARRSDGPTTQSSSVGLQSIAAPPGVGSQCGPEGYVYAASGPEQDGSSQNSGKINLTDLSDRFRVALYLKFQSLGLRGTAQNFSDSPKPTMEHYNIDPLGGLDSKFWISRLEASFYATLNRSYLHLPHPNPLRWNYQLEEGGLERIAIRLYAVKEKLFFYPPREFHEHSSHRPEYEVAFVGGELRETFVESAINPFEVELVFELTPTPEEIQEALDAALNHLNNRAPLREERERWRQKRGKFDPQSERSYQRAINQSFSYDADWILLNRGGETAGAIHNPDLYLLHQFLGPILWKRFFKQLEEQVQMEMKLFTSFEAMNDYLVSGSSERN